MSFSYQFRGELLSVQHSCPLLAIKVPAGFPAWTESRRWSSRYKYQTPQTDPLLHHELLDPKSQDVRAKWSSQKIGWHLDSWQFFADPSFICWVPAGKNFLVSMAKRRAFAFAAIPATFCSVVSAFLFLDLHRLGCDLLPSLTDRTPRRPWNFVTRRCKVHALWWRNKLLLLPG